MSTSGQTIPHSNVETHKIKKIEFGILNPDEIVLFILMNRSKEQ